MKILVFAHQLEIGGTQINAIDLATQVRATHGHEFVFFAAQGPMSTTLSERGFRLIESPWWVGRPSWKVFHAFTKTLWHERPDLIHVWDWWQYLDALLPAELVGRTPVVVTDMMSEYYERPLPRHRLTTYGTPAMVDWAIRRGATKAELLLPPVDLSSNSIERVNGDGFRKSFGVDDSELLVVSVSRLAHHFKGDSLGRAVDAVGRLAEGFRVRLVLVGDGNARGALELSASAINERIGRPVIQFAGHLMDPRPAYAAADMVIGMGGSALRAMAFAKPLLVVGSHGFARALTPRTADEFHYQGLHGIGDGQPGSDVLQEELEALLVSADARSEAANCALEFVRAKHSLEDVGAELCGYYERSFTESRSRATVMGEITRAGKFAVSEKLRSQRGRPAAWMSAPPRPAGSVGG